MAFTKSPMSVASGLYVIRDASADVTVDADVTSGAAVLYVLEIDNTLNSAKSYFKGFNTASVTVGTTEPSLVLPVEASTKQKFSWHDPTGASEGGIAFATALSYLVTTTPGLGGVSDPSPSLAVAIAMTVS